MSFYVSKSLHFDPGQANRGGEVENYVTKVLFSPLNAPSPTMLVATSDGALRVIDAATFQVVSTVTGTAQEREVRWLSETRTDVFSMRPCSAGSRVE